jgi:hypothetical protein
MQFEEQLKEVRAVKYSIPDKLTIELPLTFNPPENADAS